MRLKVSSAKYRPICLGHNVLMRKVEALCAYLVHGECHLMSIGEPCIIDPFITYTNVIVSFGDEPSRVDLIAVKYSTKQKLGHHSSWMNTTFIAFSLCSHVNYFVCMQQSVTLYASFCRSVPNKIGGTKSLRHRNIEVTYSMHSYIEAVIKS